MIDINKEAEEYAQNICEIKERTLGLEFNKAELLKEDIVEDFIAGHNSKATQQKIIQAQIDILNKAWKLKPPVDELIYELELKLKNLENEPHWEEKLRWHKGNIDYDNYLKEMIKRIHEQEEFISRKYETDFEEKDIKKYYEKGYTILLAQRKLFKKLELQ